MSTGTSAQSLAQEGLRRIEDAILELLHRNPQGLRNVQIADTLSLRSGVRGGQKNYLTYSVLGRLVAKGNVSWDQGTKLYTKLNADTTVQSLAQEGLQRIEDAVLELLHSNPQGLRNVEIADTLGLHSEVRGGRRNYLSYSVLGGLVDQGKVVWDEETKIFTAA